MADDDQDETTFHTSSEESQRLAEQAFGGGSKEAPVFTPSSEGGATAAPSATPAPAPVSPTVPPPPGIPTTKRPRKRRNPWGLFVGFLLFDIVIAIAIGGYFLVKGLSDSTDPSKPGFSLPKVPGVPSIPSLPNLPTTPAPETPAGTGDFFTTAGLRAGKAQAMKLAGPGARIQLARITQDQMQVIARGKIVLISPAITRSIGASTGTTTGNEFGFSSLNPAVAGRLTRAIARRYHVPASAINYMVVIRDPIDKKIEWLVYPNGGSGHFEANARGGGLRRVG
jgi:hypothetical protein